jgi:zinc protease
VQSVTADNVMAAARALFDRRRSVTAYLMSDDEEATQ